MSQSPRARNADPQTSHAAAASVAGISRLQANILALYHHQGPMTDENLTYRYQEMTLTGDYPPASLSGVRTRRKELVILGRLHDTGLKGRTDTGRHAILWGLAT